MSLSVVSDETTAGRQLQVTIQNVGGNDLLVPLGIINNTKGVCRQAKARAHDAGWKASTSNLRRNAGCDFRSARHFGGSIALGRKLHRSDADGQILRARRIREVGSVLLPFLPNPGRDGSQERRLLSIRLPQSEHVDVLAGHVAVECHQNRLPSSLVVEPTDIFLERGFPPILRSILL